MAPCDVFTYIYSCLIEKGICESRNLSVKFPYVYLYLSSGGHFIFLIRVFPFYSYFVYQGLNHFYLFRLKIVHAIFERETNGLSYWNILNRNLVFKRPSLHFLR
jgi:hypothetical protein